MCPDTTGAYAIAGRTPRQVEYPATIDELGRSVAAAHAANLAVVPVGNGTQLHIGRAPTRYDLALSTQRLNRVLAHAAADMTVTVEAGITLADLNATLAAARQRLPLDPPHPERTTIGALIATDASGPLRLLHGKVRDLLIGITVVLADGTLAHGGGRVVKNVAGYDLMKLFTGSFGTLGIVVEATFKLRPLPEQEMVCVLPAETTDGAFGLAVELLRTPVAPQYVEALSRAGATCVGLDGPAIVIGCGGIAEEIAVQRHRLAESSGRRLRVCSASEAERLYAALRDFPTDARRPGTRDADSGCGCILSVRPSQLASLVRSIEEAATRRRVEAAILSHVGNGVAVIRCVDVADSAALPSFADWLRRTVRAAGGWTFFDHLPGSLVRDIDPWDADPPGLALMRGIKQTLDPSGCLSPGRFVGGI
ncbi:MAG TPA: FAD-binding oxidoreductase [Candidatus Margulisiibacteriota bacterium]|nr:FAD-binding oxidoreductase [Candidatus Margulisiibacteriota bacterium]